MNIGGQAVIEGIMMRNKEKFAIAVRTKNNKIKVKKEKNTKYPQIFHKFFIRGIIGLAYTLYDGIRAMIWSSNQQLEKEEKMTNKEVFFSVGISLLFAIIIFVALPFFVASYLIPEGVWFNILDGIFRISIFLIYLIVISFMKDVKILFQYHGAEHKAIACNESGEDLILKNVRKYSRFHPRCGTSFIFIVLIMSIIIFSFLTGSWYIKLFGRILFLPIIAGLSYELIRLSGKYHKNSFIKILVAPGLWLQRITTKEPNDQQLEVSIVALKNVLE